MLHSWFKRKNKQKFAPEGQLIYAIGDVHGRDDLLLELMAKITADQRATAEGRPVNIVLLGDYIDRGMGSKAVVDILLGWKNSTDPGEFDVNMYFLKGNHEEAILHFLADPEFGQQWVSYGGTETLLSYGLQQPKNNEDLAAWEATARALRSAMGPQHIAFMQDLLPSVTLGDYIFVHAGLRPGKKLEQQIEQDMLWIREEFLNDTASFEKKVVHGHTAKQEPYQDHRRIGIDTGAYITGVLTAVRLETDTASFLQTGL